MPALPFEQFTNRYELSKTLKRELKPVWETGKLLEEMGIIAVDKKRKEAYDKVKPYIDKIHRKFIEVALSKVKDDLLFSEEVARYFSLYQNWKKDRKNSVLQKQLEKNEQILRKRVVSYFSEGVKTFLAGYPNMGFTKKTQEFLYEAPLFKLLKREYGNDQETLIPWETGDEVSIFDGWDNWLWYFKKFFETRKNLYKADGTSTALATRIIDKNLRIFLDNILIYQKLQEKEIFPKELQDTSSQIFDCSFYVNCFLQDGVLAYNRIIGGETLANGKKIKGLNEYINEYKGKTKEKLPYFKKLQNQVFSGDRLFIWAWIQDEVEFKDCLSLFYQASQKRVQYLQEMISQLWQYNDAQYAKIYLTKFAFENFTYQYVGGVKDVERAVYQAMKADNILWIAYKKSQNKYTFPDFIPIIYLKRALLSFPHQEHLWKERFYSEDILDISKSLWEQFCILLMEEFSSMMSREVEYNGEKKQIGYVSIAPKIVWALEDKQFSLSLELQKDVKEFADIARKIYIFGKKFACEKDRDRDVNIDLDSDFYIGEHGYIENFYENAYEEIIVPYNQMRNFISKKPRESTKKRKLNFEGVNLLWWWDINKESENLSVILRKENNYYLGIMKDSTIFERASKEVKKLSSDWCYEKMIYKYMKDVSLSIPKVSTQIKAVIQHFKKSDEYFILEKGSRVGKFVKPLVITKEIFELNNRIYRKEDLNSSIMRSELDGVDEEKGYVKKFQKEYLKLGGDPKVYRKALDSRIDFCKEVVASYPSCAYFDYSSLKPTSEYESLDVFYAHLDKLGYALSWENFSEEYIHQCIRDQKLYLFQIYSQDFSGGKKKGAQKNTHTLYFEQLFSPENAQAGYIFKLNGNGEVFFREATAPEKLWTKQDSKGKEVINHKRYAKDKIFFHFPIELNRVHGTLSAYAFNQEVNSFLAKNHSITLLWIDRWEKNLAHFSVIDQSWKLLESWSFNRLESYDKQGNLLLTAEKKIVEERDENWNITDYSLGKTWKQVPYIDYKLLLEYREKKRKIQRQSWKEVDKIKDLKKGYVAAVVKKIVDLVLKYQAIVIFEDLNMRFKQIRWGIEKSIYQQLEKALIDKLNFLVNKNETNPQKAGHFLRGYQLTAPFESFKDMGKQTGIIFYTQAAYTSKIDPLTWWRPNLYIKKQDAEKNKENICNFDRIIFDPIKKAFAFTYDLKEFVKSDQAIFPAKTQWTVFSAVERFRWNKSLANNKGDYDHYENLTDGKLLNRDKKEWEFCNFKELFGKYNIDIHSDILEQIHALPIKWNEKFFSEFFFLFSLVLQIRNTDPKGQGDHADFILSPVEPFFDSRKSAQFGVGLPTNGDDNGSYNIARKGIIILQRLQEQYLLLEGKVDLYITNVEWDDFIQK